MEVRSNAGWMFLRVSNRLDTSLIGITAKQKCQKSGDPPHTWMVKGKPTGEANHSEIGPSHISASYFIGALAIRRRTWSKQTKRCLRTSRPGRCVLCLEESGSPQPFTSGVTMGMTVETFLFLLLILFLLFCRLLLFLLNSGVDSKPVPLINQMGSWPMSTLVVPLGEESWCPFWLWSSGGEGGDDFKSSFTHGKLWWPVEANMPAGRSHVCTGKGES